MAIDRGMDKADVVCIFNGILLNHKKEILPILAIWLQVEMIILSEVSQRKTNII